MGSKNLDSFKSFGPLKSGGKAYNIFRLQALSRAYDISRLPFSLRVLLENLLRHEDGHFVREADIKAVADWAKNKPGDKEVSFMPARVLMQDFTGVPAVVDLAAMRDAIGALGGDAGRINPLVPVDLVIDHSVQVDRYGAADALAFNSAIEFERNKERYAFLKWGKEAFSNFSVIPPDTGIVHQINIEHIARVVWTRETPEGTLAYPDTVVGTDSHTTMVNGLGILGWGVGGIEAEAVMLGQPVAMLVPEVVGMKLSGTLPRGSTATDAVLTAVQMLRKKGVVGKFVEFYGPGLDSLSLADRATIANMAPEYGATMGFFPVDSKTIEYLAMTGRPQELLRLVEDYCRAQGLYRTEGAPDPVFSDTLSLDLGSVVPSLAGPRRPQDRIVLSEAKAAWDKDLPEFLAKSKEPSSPTAKARVKTDRGEFELAHGSVVIAAITSCTNTSNPSVLLGAGILAKKAVEKGLFAKPWVKTSLAPGSQVVTDYLQDAGLLPYLEKLNFHVVGYGCTTCIGNSGPLAEPIAEAVTKDNLVVAAVLSGNRNFEGRVNPHVKANYLASPLLVVAYALAGRMDIDITQEPLGFSPDGKPVTLKELWPTEEELAAALRSVKKEMFVKRYAEAGEGDGNWRSLKAEPSVGYAWDKGSTYVRKPPYFEGFDGKPLALKDIRGARVLGIFGDSVTTDHISPAGNIAKTSPAAKYLVEKGVKAVDFNSYGARRGNHEVMMRGTFANIRIRNLMLEGVEGGLTLHLPEGAQMSIYDAAMKYKEEKVPLIVLAGKEYGSGSSRDWAAKGPALQGVKAVIAQSFERIHRSNLVGMGVLPLQFEEGQSAQSLGLKGTETFDILGAAEGLAPRKKLKVSARGKDGAPKEFTVLTRIDTPAEVEYYRYGGILPYVLSQLAASSKKPVCA